MTTQLLTFPLQMIGLHMVHFETRIIPLCGKILHPHHTRYPITSPDLVTRPVPIFSVDLEDLGESEHQIIAG